MTLATLESKRKAAQRQLEQARAPQRQAATIKAAPVQAGGKE